MLIGDIQVDTLKTVFLAVVVAQTAAGAHPQTAVLGHKCAVYFVARQRVMIVVGIAVGLPLLCVGLIMPQTHTLCGKPEVPFMVFVDIDDHRLDSAVVLKGLGLRIVAVQSLHGAYPDVTCLVAVDGIAAVVIERVGIVAVNVMPHIARLSVEHENTVAIGADPEIVFIVET